MEEQEAVKYGLEVIYASLIGGGVLGTFIGYLVRTVVDYKKDSKLQRAKKDLNVGEHVDKTLYDRRVAAVTELDRDLNELDVMLIECNVKSRSRWEMDRKEKLLIETWRKVFAFEKKCADHRLTLSESMLRVLGQFGNCCNDLVVSMITCANRTSEDISREEGTMKEFLLDGIKEAVEKADVLFREYNEHKDSLIKEFRRALNPVNR